MVGGVKQEPGVMVGGGPEHTGSHCSSTQGQPQHWESNRSVFRVSAAAAGSPESNSTFLIQELGLPPGGAGRAAGGPPARQPICG